MSASTPKPAPAAEINASPRLKRNPKWRSDMYRRSDNGDGTYDSRCLHCLMTVARDLRSEGQLSGAERRHICVEKALFELLDIRISELTQGPTHSKLTHAHSNS